MTRLKELLSEFAEQARPYQVRQQALRRGRRRRRMRLVVPAGLVVLSLAATGLTLLSRHPQHAEPQPAEPQPTLPRPADMRLPTSQLSLPGYPAEIVTDADAPPLPSDEPVGPGLLVYTNTAGPWFGLVTEAGVQYRLNPLDGDPYALSPGGRWLASFAPDGSSTPQLRDLTGTAVITLPGYGIPAHWSADDRWVLTARTPTPDAPSRPETATLVDLSRTTLSPQEIDLRPWPGYVPAAVRADGTVVLWSAGGDRLGDVVLVDPATGGGRVINFDLSAAATPDELAATAQMSAMVGSGGAAPLRLLPDGTAMLQLWQAFGGAPLEAPTVYTDVLVLDLDARVVRERWDLPGPHPIRDNPRGDWASWSVKTVLPEGLLLTHRSTQRVWAWELYDPTTGDLSLVTDLRGLASAKED